MFDWPQKISAVITRDARCAVVTVTQVRGSAPREPGSKLWLSATQQGGSIGGGYLEHACQKLAREQLKQQRTTPLHRRFALGSQCGQCCGGVVEVMVEILDTLHQPLLDTLSRLQSQRTPAQWISHRDGGKAVVNDGHIVAALLSDSAEHVPTHARDSAAMWLTDRHHKQPQWFSEPVGAPPLSLVIFGAGHVGRACSQVFSTLDAAITVVDNREVYLSAETWPDNVSAMLAVDPEQFVPLIPADSYCLIMTHDHALDLKICHRILDERPDLFCGLIGSLPKRRRFEKKLRALGLSDEEMGRLVCPIGIDGISGKKPGEIAISVAAQVLSERQRVQTVHSNDTTIRAVS